MKIRMKYVFLFIFLFLLPGSLSAETYQTPKGIKIPFSKVSVSIPTPSPTQKSSRLNIEPDFIPYVVAMKKYYSQYNNGEPLLLGKLSIVRGELFNVVLGMDSDAIGECHEKTHKIIIGRWVSHGECQREELITHEIGHCLFDMTHDWGGFMEAKIHTEAECKLNASNFREHFYKSAKKQVDWKKEQSKKRAFLSEEYFEMEDQDEE